MTDTTAKSLKQLGEPETRRIVDAVLVCHELIRLDTFVGPLYGQCTCGRVFPVSAKGKTGINLHREHIWSVLIEQAEVRGVAIDITRVESALARGAPPDASDTQEPGVPELSEQAVMDAFRTRAPVTIAAHDFVRAALTRIAARFAKDLQNHLEAEAQRISRRPRPTVPQAVHSIEDVGGGP